MATDYGYLDPMMIEEAARKQQQSRPLNLTDIAGTPIESREQEIINQAAAKQRELSGIQTPYTDQPVSQLEAGAFPEEQTITAPIEKQKQSALSILSMVPGGGVSTKGFRDIKQGMIKTGEKYTSDIGTLTVEQDKLRGQQKELIEKGVDIETKIAERQQDLMATTGKALSDLESGYNQIKEQAQQDVMAKRQKYDEAAGEYMAARIDPNRFWKDEEGNVSVPRSIGAILAMALSGFGMALKGRGGENPAMNIINRQIDKDIAIQKAQIQKLGMTADLAKTAYGIASQNFDNEQSRYIAARNIKMDELKYQLDVAAQQYKSPQLQLKKEELFNALDEQKIQSMGKAMDAEFQNKMDVLVKRVPVESQLMQAQQFNVMQKQQQFSRLIEASKKSEGSDLPYGAYPLPGMQPSKKDIEALKKSNADYYRLQKQTALVIAEFKKAQKDDSGQWFWGKMKVTPEFISKQKKVLANLIKNNISNVKEFRNFGANFAAIEQILTDLDIEEPIGPQTLISLESTLRSIAEEQKGVAQGYGMGLHDWALGLEEIKKEQQMEKEEQAGEIRRAK